MEYAFLGDIHSSVPDLSAVLWQIKMTAPGAKLLGTGDLYECIISKKNITDHKFTAMEDVMLLPDELGPLIDFPSIRGNQEERIVYITETDDPLREKLTQLPEKMEAEGALVIHGHQWNYGENPWNLLPADRQLVFFGHTHRSELYRSAMPETPVFGAQYEIGGGRTLVNVGSVIDNREWVLYDSLAQTVRFMKAD